MGVPCRTKAAVASCPCYFNCRLFREQENSKYVCILQKSRRIVLNFSPYTWYIWQSRKLLLVVITSWEDGVWYWHLVIREQRCCSGPTSQNKELSGPYVSSVEVREIYS